ncbi:ABC transporter ATP-binding protein, partial [Leucobacter albus]
MSKSHSISLTQASVRFGTTLALEGFAGTFEPGTVSAVIGGDGSGKSTLLRALSGRVPFRAHTSAGLPVPRTEVGYLPATSGVWRNLSVAENVEFVAHTFGLSAATTRARSARLLERAGLAEAKDRLAGRLSGGMRQKLGVVLATLHSPALVLLDEPTTGVDPISRAEVWSLIAASAAEGATVVFTTTYLDEAERAHQLFLLGDGRLLASGSVADVVQQAPGRIWEAAAARPGARAALRAPRSWRRGGTIYLWDPSPAAAAPPGFRAAIPDLENTSIALLTARHEAAASGPRPHSNARTDVSSRTRASKRPHSQPPVPLGGASGASG